MILRPTQARRLSLTLALALALSTLLLGLPGCGGTSPIPQPGPASPHGGVMIPIPGGLGFVEIVKQTDPARKKQAQMLVYFLDSRSNAPSTLPTNVSYKPAASGEKPVTLEALPDPARPNAMISPPLADRGELDGEINATFDGKPVTIPINAR